MNVTVAKTAGFCFGVKRAVEKVYEQIQKTDKPIYTYGPIIHNEEVVKDLKKKGVEVIGSEEELERVRDCVVVIRSHGVGKHIYDILEKNGVEIVDATCPYVKKIHRVVAGECAEGGQVIIVGDESHPIEQLEMHQGSARRRVDVLDHDSFNSLLSSSMKVLMSLKER